MSDIGIMRDILLCFKGLLSGIMRAIIHMSDIIERFGRKTKKKLRVFTQFLKISPILGGNIGNKRI